MGRQSQRSAGKKENTVTINSGNMEFPKTGNPFAAQSGSAGKTASSGVQEIAAEKSKAEKKLLHTLIYAVVCLVLVIAAMIIKIKYFSIAITVVLALGIYVVFDAFMSEKEKKRNRNYMAVIASALMIAGSIGLYLARVLPVLFELYK